MEQADTIYNDPEGAPILRRVEQAFRALTAARAKFNRCTREDSRKAAELELQQAEIEYREAADARDRFVEIFNARKMQRSTR